MSFVCEATTHRSHEGHITKIAATWCVPLQQVSTQINTLDKTLRCKPFHTTFFFYLKNKQKNV